MLGIAIGQSDSPARPDGVIAAQVGDDLPRLIEATHMGVAGGEIASDRGPDFRVVLNREEQCRGGFSKRRLKK